jgi:FtsP/CotA-like multicopper oxidase with cupredoxin domain
MRVLSRRELIPMLGAVALRASPAPDHRIVIAPYTLDLSPRVRIRTTAYNQQVPGPLFRFTEGRPVTIEVENQSSLPEIVHWHGLFLPPEVDGSMEEGTPEIAPGKIARYTFTPSPSGFRWFHTHTMAGRDLTRALYGGQHGFLYVEPKDGRPGYDSEFFLSLGDWKGMMVASDDGSMNPEYSVSAINGKMFGFGEPLRVKQGERALLHILNASATEAHWIVCAGHQFHVVALDGNPVPRPAPVSMLRLAPAERVSALIEMANPGVWVLGEVRTHIRDRGMGMVLEYAGRKGNAQWLQPESLDWSYARFAGPRQPPSGTPLTLSFNSRFAGHGAPDHWTINGKSFPKTVPVRLQQGERYRLRYINQSSEPHPVHLHRHLFEVSGILKDTVLVEPKSEMEVELVANHPGLSLFHCHQQNHMDMGFMMLFTYV